MLVIAHPSDPQWEATTGEGEPRLTDAEIEAIAAWVEAGGGLIVLGETEQEKYGNNLNELLGRFGIEIENTTVQDYEHHRGEAPSWILADLVESPDAAGADPLAGVSDACFYRAGTLALSNGARVIARTSPSAAPPTAPLAAVTRYGAGRVVVLADSDLFGDDCIDELDHESFWVNLAYFAAEPAFGAGGRAGRVRRRGRSRLAAGFATRSRSCGPTRPRTARSTPPAPTRRGCASWSRRSRQRLGGAAAALPPSGRLHRGARRGSGRSGSAPGSASPTSCARSRRSGRSATVATGSSTSSSSRCTSRTDLADTCFEALIVRVPWPRWAVELESRYDNAKFLPVEFVDYTSGYDSECAVLFPETFSAPDRPPAYFGAIFCDREAERFRRVSGSAAEILRLNLPPDAACLLASPELSRDAYIVWDLIHDRTHMRGDLPFDPFMIRQRSPYWMYSLEELRCDLTAFGEAVKLEAEGFALARHVQYAILFDRLFRFPLTGGRVRNYDGLGGQLLFAFLHHEGYLHWTDNRLVIEWGRVAEGVGKLARAGRRALPLGHRPLEARAVDRRSRSRRHLRPAGRGLGLGARSAATCPRSRSRSSSSTSSATTSSRSASSTRSSRRSSSRRSTAGRGGADRGRGRRLMGELDGRVIAVAGVGGGLGPVVAERLAGAGATLALADLDVDRIEAAVEGLGIPEERLDTQAVDLLDEATRRPGGARSLQERFGRVDGLLHLVGGWRGGDPIESFDMADYEWLHDLLVRTLQNASRAFHDALTESEHGRFALVSSTQAQAPEATNAAYAATKAAAESWTLALADSFAGSRRDGERRRHQRDPDPGDAGAEPRQGVPDLHPGRADRRGARLPLLRRGRRG